jgi:molybdopterin converting factor small subunit
MKTRVTLKFTGEFWARSGTGSVDFSFEGTTLRDLLRAVFLKYNVRDILLDGNDQFVFRSGVLVNGRSVKWIGGLDAPIYAGDEVILMRPSLGAM